MRRRQSTYPGDDNWVFASPAKRDKLPYWSFSLFHVYIKPALKEAGITGKVDGGEDVKTVQELMRHANSSVTLNSYA